MKGVLIIFPRHLANDWCKAHQFVSFDIWDASFYSTNLANAHAQIKFLWLTKSCLISDAIKQKKKKKKTSFALKQALKSMSCLAKS